MGIHNASLFDPPGSSGRGKLVHPLFRGVASSGGIRQIDKPARIAVRETGEAAAILPSGGHSPGSQRGDSS